jgi:hypothetical protein
VKIPVNFPNIKIGNQNRAKKAKESNNQTWLFMVVNNYAKQIQNCPIA